MMGSVKVRLGSERLLESGALKHQRVGVVSNPASLDANLRHIVRAISADPDVKLAALFGPQHGYHADVQDNMIETPHVEDPTRGVPVYSLYSETREPTAEMLKGLDVLVIDLQDVGSRIYTFIYTMANCLRGCRKHGLPVVVADRPNPIGGMQLDGPMLVSGFESFVGSSRSAAPWMTIGWQGSSTPSSASGPAVVVPMNGWQRAMHFDDTGLLWSCLRRTRRHSTRRSSTRRVVRAQLSGPRHARLFELCGAW
jgi:uncharacterized protein YbbC (DUF1343 family)